MTTDRIKEIQDLTTHPQSQSVQQALLKVWNECEQESNIKYKELLLSHNELLKVLEEISNGDGFINPCCKLGQSMKNAINKAKNL